MIRISRTPKPAVLVRKADEWQKCLSQAHTEKERKRAEARYRHEEIKEVLCRMFHGKCAYCESKLTHVDFGDIEHYRPKSKWPQLTFEWENLMLACGICNQNKWDHFPEADEGGPIINPTQEDPDVHLDFSYDPKAKLATVHAKTVRGETSRKLLGLNRNELRAYRSTQITKLACLALMAASDKDAKGLLQEAALPGSEYSAFARQLFQGFQT